MADLVRATIVVTVAHLGRRDTSPGSAVLAVSTEAHVQLAAHLRAMILVGGLFQAVNYHNTQRDYGKGYFTWENPGRRASTCRA